MLKAWLAVVLMSWTMVCPVGAVGQVRTQARAFAGVDDAGNATTVEAALRVMTEQAAVVFVGTVLEVRRTSGDGMGFGTATGVVEVRFQVEQGVRGVGTGETYTLREWAGLWTSTEQRYKTGSRLLVLLHAPGATGLSSPVGGMDGVLPVKGGSQRIGSAEATEAAETEMVDLRWVAAKLPRTVEYRRSGAAARSTTVSGATAEGAERSVAMAQASVGSVVGMMAGWAKGAADAR